MPGYLTHLMVLIETEKWLGEIVQKLAPLPNPGRLEKEVLRLARRARSYLRYDPGSEAPVPPPAAPAAIENQGPGDQISKYSYAGTLGPDFPAASYILAINQKWVSQTMHRGSPLRAWQNAGTTKFVLQFIDAITRENPVPDAKAPLMSYIIGHVSSVATHVLIHPFILHATWGTGRNHNEMEIALDAKLAILYFKRKNMFTGQSWESYYLDKGDFEEQIKRLMEVYLEVFKSTYGSPYPLETMCGLPSIPELESRFSEIDSVPGLKQALSPYPGFDAIKPNFTQLESGPLGSFLSGYECTSAKLDVDFLVDGYRNTVNWAIDEGYDESPDWLRVIWLFTLTGGAMLTCFMVWDSTENFGPSAKFIFGEGGMFGLDPAEFEAVKNDKLAAWQSDGFAANERMWFDALDNSYSVAGYMILPFSMLLTGPLIGIFRQGTKTYAGRIVFTIFKTVVFSVTLFLLRQGLPKTMADAAPRWCLWLMATAMDVVNVLALKAGDVEKGQEADRFSLEMYKLQLVVAAAYFVACPLAFSVKSSFAGTGGARREVGIQFRDFALMFPIPFMTFLVFIFGGDTLHWFDSNWIENLIGVKWPSDDTRIVDTFLTANQQGLMQNGSAGNVSVRLFPEGNMGTSGDKKWFPEAAATTPFSKREKENERERSDKSASFPSLGLKNLLDRAKYFSGLLAMAAARYDTAVGADQKAKAATVFKDWNLDFRTQQEWNDLMSTDQPKGLLEVVENWWTQSGQVDTRILEEFFGTAVPTHSGRIEDRSVAPRFAGSDSNRKYLKTGTPFNIKDRDGNVVYTGNIGMDGRFEATLPPGSDYELTIDTYEGLKT